MCVCEEALDLVHIRLYIEEEIQKGRGTHTGRNFSGEEIVSRVAATFTLLLFL